MIQEKTGENGPRSPYKCPMTKIFTAIGNACTDLIAKVDDQFLAAHNIRKYFCIHFKTVDELNAVMADMPPYQSIAGGAGANVAHVVAALGGMSHFISKIGSDRAGAIFQKNMEDNGVTCHFPPPSQDDKISSQVLTLITPDGERTFASFDEVARTMTFDDFDTDILARTSVLYLDGYCYCSPHTPDSFVRAAENVRATGGHAVFNVGDLSNYEANTAAIDKLLSVCDGLTCNMPEAEAFFGKQSSTLSLVEKIAARFLFGGVTDGQNGAYVFYNGQVAHVPAISISDLAEIDTNGAGDHFSGGFIYGLMQGFTLEQAGKLGVLCAKDCISHAGARPTGSLKHLAAQAKN